MLDVYLIYIQGADPVQGMKRECLSPVSPSS